MLEKALHEAVISEQRKSERDRTNDARITSFIQLPNGTTLEGVAKDISDGGMKIAGSTQGLNIDDEFDIVLVVLNDQKIRYKVKVRHIDRIGEFYGLKFLAGPQPVEDTPAMWCKRCRREFSGTANFCPDCGQRLRRR